MTVLFTVVIPTIGRESLTRAVESVLNSPFQEAEIEIVVVNDSGKPLPTAKWHHSEKVYILETNRRERCFARNSGAAIAHGTYLCFLDDDDWFLPEGLSHLYELAKRYPEAAWLYGGVQVVDDNGTCIVEMNSGLNGNCFAQVMGGAWVALQSSCVRADVFFKVGGYRTELLSTQDLDLCRRVALTGDLANTAQPIACLFRGDSWNTSTNYLQAAENTKWSRDNILTEPNTFEQLVKSADSAYWYGRVFRVYWSTVVWNLRRGKVLRAFGRALYGFCSMVVASRHLLSAEYWAGVRAHHTPGTFHYYLESTKGASHT